MSLRPQIQIIVSEAWYWLGVNLRSSEAVYQNVLHLDSFKIPQNNMYIPFKYRTGRLWELTMISNWGFTWLSISDWKLANNVVVTKGIPGFFQYGI